MKYNELTLGTIEAVINKLGGVDGVRRFLSGEIIVQTVATVYALVMDYTLSLCEMISAGKYDWVNNDITEANFPKVPCKVSVETELLHFRREILYDSAIAEMDKMGFRPATIWELLSFGASNPEIQRQFPIVAFGSSCEVNGDVLVPYLASDGSERLCSLGWRNFVWFGNHRFLVVRK